MERQCAKSFLKSLSIYEDQKEKVERAVDPIKPSLVKSHAKNRVQLEESFSGLSYDFKRYKKEVNVTEEVFNGTSDDGPTYEYNDGWFKDLEDAYFDLLEKSDEALEEEPNTKQDVAESFDTETNNFQDFYAKS